MHFASNRVHADSGARKTPRQTAIKLKVVALVASAGGLQALMEILSSLPQDFPAAIVVLQHLSPDYRSRLPEILSRNCQLIVKQASEGDQLKPGWVLVAAPAMHLLINRDRSLSLVEGEPIHFVRPSADLLLHSLAANIGKGGIAVVLSGSGSDGASSLAAVKAAGGIIIAQDERTSQSFGMPGAAIRSGFVDHVLPLNQIAGMLVQLVGDKQRP